MNKENKVKNVLFCLWVTVAFILILQGSGLPLFIKAAIDALAQAGGDMNAYMSIYMESINKLGFTVQILGTVLALVVSAIWFFRGYSKTYSAEEKAESKTMLKNGYLIIALIFGTIAFYGFDFILANVTEALAPSTREFYDSIMSYSLSGNPILVFIIVVILAPINEELIFRGIIIRRSQRAFSSIVPVIIIEAVLFGVYHCNILQGFYAMFIGAFFGVIAYKYKSIIPSIFAHMLNNFFAMYVAGNLPERFLTIPTFAIVLVVCGAIAIAMLVLNKKKNAVAAE